MTSLASLRIKIKKIDDEQKEIKKEFLKIIDIINNKTNTHPLGDKKE